MTKQKYYKFTTANEASAWGDAHYSEWANKYKNRGFETLDDRVVECYCGYDFRHMNYILRNPECDYLAKHIYQAMSIDLKNIISQAPKIPENIIVYRCVPNSFIEELKNLYNRIVNDGWVQEKGFLSTSLNDDIDVEHGFDGILRIRVTKGTPGIYTPCVAGRGERELLLPPNCHIRLIGFLKISIPKIRKYRVYDCQLKCSENSESTADSKSSQT